MATSDAEDTTLISYHRATKLRNAERVVESHFVRDILFNVEEMDRLAAPFEVVHELVGRVALLQNESVMQQFTILVDHINVLVVGDAAGELA